MNAVPITGLGLLACLYTMEASELLAALALYKNGDKPLTAVLTGRYGPFFLAGCLSVLGLAVYLVTRYRGSRTGQGRQLGLTVAMNIATLALAFLC